MPDGNMSKTAKVTGESFEAEVLGSGRPVLVDFWADWCHPCHLIAPELEALANDQPAFKVAKLNIDEEPDTASAYGVFSIPTLVLFAGGREVTRLVGVRPKERILAEIRPYIGDGAAA